MLRFLLLALVVAAIGIGVIAASTMREPVLSFDESVPADLRALAGETWQDFIESHPARLHCIAPVSLAAAWELDSRAEYRPGNAEVVVRVPGTPATLRNQMIHEFAHHLEFTCSDHVVLRPDFLEAQGFSIAAGWFDGASWEATPSEQYAEATVELILGPRSHHGNIFISREAAEVVRRWASGS